MDSKVKTNEILRTVPCPIESATVVEAGDLVALSSGYIIKATAGSAAVAYAPAGSARGETTIQVTVGNDFTLKGTADANAAITDKGGEVDLVVTDGVQLIDLGESTTDVLKVAIAEDSLTAGSTADVEVRINKPIF